MKALVGAINQEKPLVIVDLQTLFAALLFRVNGNPRPTVTWSRPPGEGGEGEAETRAETSLASLGSVLTLHSVTR